jgi:hypothetical protein
MSIWRWSDATAGSWSDLARTAGNTALRDASTAWHQAGKLRLMNALNTIVESPLRATAALALAVSTLLAAPAQAASVAASYSFTATEFGQGGTLSGSIAGTLFDWPAAPMPPFAAGSGRMLLTGVSAFSASFGGSSVLPAASFDLADLVSLTLVDDGTFGAGGGSPGAAPALFDLLAYDAASNSELFIRFAALPGAVALLSGDPGAGVDWLSDDISARLSDQVSVRLNAPGQVPEPAGWALVALALLALALTRRARPEVPGLA